MGEILIKQADERDIPVVESILLAAVGWLNEMGQPLWSADEVCWDALSKLYSINDFYIAFLENTPSGCMAIVEIDPFFWPDVQRGESLFIHKLAVVKNARKAGVADRMIDFFKQQGQLKKVNTLRLDTHALRPKLRFFYERHGFSFVGIKVYNKERHTAFYEFTL